MSHDFDSRGRAGRADRRAADRPGAGTNHHSMLTRSTRRRAYSLQLLRSMWKTDHSPPTASRCYECAGSRRIRLPSRRQSLSQSIAHHNAPPHCVQLNFSEQNRNSVRSGLVLAPVRVRMLRHKLVCLGAGLLPPTQHLRVSFMSSIGPPAGIHTLCGSAP